MYLLLLLLEEGTPVSVPAKVQPQLFGLPTETNPLIQMRQSEVAKLAS